jgi:hypothetical protein
VLKPGGKFVIQFEDYNYTISRDGKRGKECIVGGNKQGIRKKCNSKRIYR